MKDCVKRVETLSGEALLTFSTKVPKMLVRLSWILHSQLATSVNTGWDEISHSPLSSAWNFWSTGSWVIKWSSLPEIQTDVNPSLGESWLTRDFIPSMQNWHQNKPRWGLNEIISPDLGSGNCEKYALIKAQTSSNTTRFPFPTLSMRFPSKFLLIRCLKYTHYTFKNLFFNQLIREFHIQ